MIGKRKRKTSHFGSHLPFILQIKLNFLWLTQGSIGLDYQSHQSDLFLKQNFKNCIKKTQCLKTQTTLLLKTSIISTHDVIFTYQYIRINTYIYNTIKHCKMVDISRYVRYSLLLDYCSYEKTQLIPMIICLVFATVSVHLKILDNVGPTFYELTFPFLCLGYSLELLSSLLIQLT